jgi:hypothetical protein
MGRFSGIPERAGGRFLQFLSEAVDGYDSLARE